MSDLGTVRQTDDGWELRWQRHLPHPVEEVWRTLTEPDRVKTWWGLLDIDPRPGGSYVMAWQNPGGPTMHATITAFEPHRLLETVGDIHGRLRWELAPDGDGTMLTFTNVVAEPPPPDSLPGWHWHVDAIERTLAGDPLDPTGADPTHFEALRRAYAGN